MRSLSELTKKYSRAPYAHRVAALLFGFTFAALIFRALFSFCQSDEPFMLAIVHRLWQGDALIADEWQVIQLYTPILLPFYSFWRWIVPGGDGALLFFRLLYIAFSLFTAIIVYRRLYCVSFPSALFAGIMCLLYSRSNLHGMSQCNLFFCFALLFFAWNSGAFRRSKAFVQGVMLALCVLCDPFFALPVIAVSVLLFFRRGQNRGKLCWIWAGIAASAVIYLSFLFSRTSPADIVLSLKYIFSDPEHDFSFLANFKSFLVTATRFVNLLYLCVSLLACALFLFLRRKQAFHLLQRLLPSYVVISGLLILAYAVKYKGQVCFLFTYPAALLSLPCILLLEGDLKRRVSSLYILGIFAAFAFMLSSNTGMDAMTVGFCISAIAGFAALDAALKRYVLHAQPVPHKRRLCAHAALVAVVFCVLLPSCMHRFAGVFRDARLYQLTERITVGPGLGLFTTPEHAAQYNDVYQDVMRFLADGENGVFFSKLLPWAYLCTDSPCQAPTAWRLPMDDPRLQQWYALHPERLPRYVYVFYPEIGSFDFSLICKAATPKVKNVNSADGWMWDLVSACAENHVSGASADIYEIDPVKARAFLAAHSEM